MDDFLRMSHSRPIVLYFSLFFLNVKCLSGLTIVANVGIRSAYLWCRKWRLYWLSHHHCPTFKDDRVYLQKALGNIKLYQELNEQLMLHAYIASPQSLNLAFWSLKVFQRGARKLYRRLGCVIGPSLGTFFCKQKLDAWTLRNFTKGPRLVWKNSLGLCR